MTGGRRMGLVAAGATLLSSAPLAAIYEDWTWLMRCMVAVGLIAGTAFGLRTLRAPVWAQAAGMLGTLLLALTWMYRSGDELLGLLPTTGTFEHFGRLFVEAGSDTRSYGVPVPDREGLLFITVLGVAGCAVAVDLLTVVLRRPALAGLPMLAIYSVPVAVYVDSVPIAPFVVGAVGYLWLLVADNVDRVRRFGRRFTGDGRDVDVWEPSPLAAAGRRLAVVGVVAAVLLPLAVPGLTGGLLARLTQSGAGTGGGGLGPGAGGRVNLFASLSGQLTQSQTVDMVRVSTTEPDPFYLRFGVAEVVTGNGVSSRGLTGRPVSRGLPETRGVDRSRGGTYQRYRADVEVTRYFANPLAPVYASPVDTEGLDGTWSYDPNAQVVFSNRSTIRDKRYSFDYVRATFTPAQLRTAEPLGPGDPIRAAYTDVPREPQVERLVGRLTAEARTDYDKVLAIYRHFAKQNGFSYRLTTEAGTSSSDIVNFLQTKVGFCQQYAAAMTWMARAAGIPARVAFGFTRGGNRVGNTYTLTNRNLHAWTEVFFSGFGWVPFDATPAADVVGSARSGWAPDTDRPDTTVTAAPGTTGPATDTSAAPGAGTPGASRDRDIDSGLALDAEAPAQRDTGTLLWLVAAGALVLALLAVPALRRVLLRRRRHHATAAAAAGAPVPAAGGPPGAPEVVVTTEAVRARADAHAAWDELVDTMLDYRVPVDPAESPRHTARRLVDRAGLEGEPADAATLLGRAEERARYARTPLQGGELNRALGRVRRALAHTASRRTRAAAVLLPPSVLQRWRLGLADTAARWAGAAGRRRDAARRLDPRRRLAGRTR